MTSNTPVTSTTSVTGNPQMISTDNQIQISGRLTVDVVASLTDLSGHAAGHTDWVINLQQVEVVDSSAVGLMLLWLREAKRNKINLCFSNVPENLLSLARLYGVAELLPLCGNPAVPA